VYLGGALIGHGSSIFAESKSRWIQRPRPTHVPLCVTRARRGRQDLAHLRSTSVCGTAAVVTLRLRSSRLSACVPLFRLPNRKPKCDYAIALTRLKSPVKHHFSWHALPLTSVSDFASDYYPMFRIYFSVFHPKYI
jgi:hypothetical protein